MTGGPKRGQPWPPNISSPVKPFRDEASKLVHYGDIGLSANLDQAMSKKTKQKKKKGMGKKKQRKYMQKHTVLKS